MSSSSTEIGVVVVGLGMAGKVRVRDLKEETCALKLRGIVSRRTVELEGVWSYSLEEALSESEVEAVMIATENATHEEYVRKALDHGKHVLVEYPLALSSGKAQELFSLAEEKGVILHEENIVLLLESFAIVKQKAMTTQLKSGTFFHKGGLNGWIENFEKSGPPFLSSISALQALISLFGQLTVLGATINYHDGGYTTTASLQTAEARPISMTLSRVPGAKRQKREIYTFEDGEVLDTNKMPGESGKPGLFAQDMHLFYKNIQDGKISDERKNLTIYSMQVAEKIHSFF